MCRRAEHVKNAHTLTINCETQLKRRTASRTRHSRIKVKMNESKRFAHPAKYGLSEIHTCTYRKLNSQLLRVEENRKKVQSKWYDGEGEEEEEDEPSTWPQKCHRKNEVLLCKVIAFWDRTNNSKINLNMFTLERMRNIKRFYFGIFQNVRRAKQLGKPLIIFW